MKFAISDPVHPQKMFFLLAFIATFSLAGGVLLKDLDVQCSEHQMVVYISFYSKFNGIIFSKGYYDDQGCHYIRERSGRSVYKFTIPLDRCGTTSKIDYPTKNVYKFVENTLVMQEDPYIQGINDLARNVRCIWKHTFSKVVTARPMSFNSVPLVFTRQAINKVMPLHLDTSPFDNPVSGYIYMGEETSMVVYIQDPNHIFDANVKGCQVVDKKGKRMLTDSSGCYSRKNLMTPFYKTNATGDSGASMMFYSYFQGYKLSYKDNFVINCELEVCPGKCQSTCNNPVFARGKREAPVLRKETSQDEFFHLESAENETNSKGYQGNVKCAGGLNCASRGLMVTMALMAIITTLMLLLSAVLCCKFVKYRQYINEKLSTNNPPLIE